jgi:hypothetical protein
MRENATFQNSTTVRAVVSDFISTAIFVSALFVVVGAVPAAHATRYAAVASLSPAPHAATSRAVASESKPTVDELSFLTKFESFLNRDKPPAGIPDYTQIGAHFRTESDGRLLKGVLELGGSFATAIESYSNLYVPEAYLNLQTEDFQAAEAGGALRGRLSVGRRLETWSLLDRSWDMGLWEPLNRFDAIRPIDQGLTGVFLEAGAGAVRVVLFASPTFIPEQGAGFSLQNGKFRTNNPWFVEPTDRLILFSQTRDVRYDLAMPSAGKVISQASGGALVRYGSFDKGFYAQGSYAFKPRNQLETPFVGAYNLTETIQFASAQVYPTVVYHQLFGGEVGYNTVADSGGRSMGAGISVLFDAPINEAPANTERGESLTYQVLEPLMLLSPHASMALSLSHNVDVEMGVSYLYSSGGGFSMRGPFASGSNDKPVFGPRVPFREAVSLDGRMTVGKGQRSTFSAGGRWIEELHEEGSFLMVDMNVDFSMNGRTKDWRVSLMGDVLGSRLAPNDNIGYVSRYRGNDRWMSQVRFVF